MKNLTLKSDGSALYDRDAAKEPARLSVNGDLLKKANDLEIDLSTTLEGALASEIARKQREIWRGENREAIQAYNEFVAEHGVFSTGLRGFWWRDSRSTRTRIFGPGPRSRDLPRS